MEPEEFTSSLLSDEAGLLTDQTVVGKRLALILVADADSDRRDHYTSLLRDGGFDVAAAGDEATALAAADQAPSAIVISHVAPASAADLGLCRQFRAIASTRDVPVIVLTVFDDEHTREQIVRAGATAIMIEPLKQGLLLRRVRRLITHTGRRRRTS